MIFTFYSYKGGVGRSMALANTAELFFRAGKKVLIVDWDLEAPGIERYFFKNINLILNTPGLIDILLSYKEKLSKELDENQPLDLEPVSKFIIDVYPNSPIEGKLFLLHAGKRSGDYFSKYAREVLNFDWGDFYENWEGELFFEWLREQFESIAEVVLIDSRTGVTEMTGICTYQMAGTVIMFCAPNQQNIDGTYDMVMNFSSPMLTRLRTDRPLKILIVPARVEDRSEVELLNTFRNQFIDKFNPILLKKPVKGLNSYWDLKIPYFSYYSFNETLAVNEESQSYSEDIQGAFVKLADIMAKMQGEPYDFNSIIKKRKSTRDTIRAVPKNIRSVGPFTYWNEEDWDVLIYSILKNKCILMLGADTSTELLDGQSRQLSEILANQLSQKINPDIRKEINSYDLAQVSRYYCRERGRYALEAAVYSFYSQRRAMFSYLHRDIAALPFYLTITTAMDNMFVEALLQENKNPVIGWYNFRRETSKIIQMGTTENPLVFYLYGNIEEPDSLVLTEDDITDFLVIIMSRSRLPDHLINELKDPDKCFLFLGFGFKHWYLRILLRILGIENKFNRSFALEDFTPHSEAEFKSTVLFYREGPCRINLFEKDFTQFASELRRRFAAITVNKDVKPIRMEKRPRVFICHATEDSPLAASLYEKLKAAGLDPWLDKENLRAGEHWDETIQNVIKKVDYFLVLQSKNLRKKTKGYVFKEIMEARERQMRFRPGTRFIIPLEIYDGVHLEELEDLQSIPIHSEENIAGLVRLIQRDCKKRSQ